MVLQVSVYGLLAPLLLSLWQGRTSWWEEPGSYSLHDSQEAKRKRPMGQGQNISY
jgi:hypothetical protein